MDELLEALDKADDFTPRRRLMRAVEVLEGIGTDEAVRALEKIHDEMPGSWLKRDVQASLQRLKNRPTAVP